MKPTQLPGPIDWYLPPGAHYIVKLAGVTRQVNKLLSKQTDK
jgi:hypothetical protein